METAAGKSLGRALGLGLIVATAGCLVAAPAALASIYHVTSPGTAGSGTLREAIVRANSHPGGDEIAIDVDGTIALSGALPPVTDPVQVHGPEGDSVELARTSTAPRFPILAFQESASNSSLTDLSIVNGAVAPGGATQAAGGIYNEANLSLDRVTVEGNAGTGIVNRGHLTLDRSVVRSNGLTVRGAAADAAGGGIENVGSAVIDHSSIEDNVVRAVSSGTPGFAGAAGGGIANFDTKACCATLQLRRSTVSGNTATAAGDDEVDADGGGITSAAPGWVRLDRVTISGNTARTSGSPRGGAIGGGLEVTDSVKGGAVNPSTISGSTVVANEASGPDTGLGPNVDIPYANHPPELIFRNTIVALPVPKSSPNCVGAAAIASGGFNLEDGDSCGFDQATDIRNKPPKLGPLARNGGPTRTHALLLGSPAIDKGYSSGATTDQRGQTRPFDFGAIGNALGGDGSDIGAFEVQPPPNTKITDAPSQTSKRRVIISFMSTSPGSSFVCRLDGKPLGKCTSPYQTPRLSIGRHTFKVRAIDPSGAADESPASATFRVVKAG